MQGVPNFYYLFLDSLACEEFTKFMFLNMLDLSIYGFLYLLEQLVCIFIDGSCDLETWKEHLVG